MVFEGQAWRSCPGSKAAWSSQFLWSHSKDHLDGVNLLPKGGEVNGAREIRVRHGVALWPSYQLTGLGRSRGPRHQNPPGFG